MRGLEVPILHFIGGCYVRFSIFDLPFFEVRSKIDFNHCGLTWVTCDYVQTRGRVVYVCASIVSAISSIGYTSDGTAAASEKER